jgi:hypothetical protein
VLWKPFLKHELVQEHNIYSCTRVQHPQAISLLPECLVSFLQVYWIELINWYFGIHLTRAPILQVARPFQPRPGNPFPVGKACVALLHPLLAGRLYPSRACWVLSQTLKRMSVNLSSTVASHICLSIMMLIIKPRVLQVTSQAHLPNVCNSFLQPPPVHSVLSLPLLTSHVSPPSQSSPAPPLSNWRPGASEKFQCSDPRTLWHLAPNGNVAHNLSCVHICIHLYVFT